MMPKHAERRWSIEYFEMADGTQPAEGFEDTLARSANRDEVRLAGKLVRLAGQVEEKGMRVGGGYVESCHDAPGVWQMKADVGGRRGREFFAFDDDRAVLLHGVTKGPREPTPQGAYRTAMSYLEQYRRTRRISPEEAEDGR